jgi:hypothetical protein
MKAGSPPGVAFTDDDFLLTARQDKVIETRLQEGFLRRPLNTLNGHFSIFETLKAQATSSKFQTPNSKLQAPKKHQAPSSKKTDLRAVCPGICYWGLVF